MEQVNHPLGLWRKMRQGRQESIFPGSLAAAGAQQRIQSQAADADGGVVEKGSAVELELVFYCF